MQYRLNGYRINGVVVSEGVALGRWAVILDLMLILVWLRVSTFRGLSRYA
jgi:hypothetical protein